MSVSSYQQVWSVAIIRLLLALALITFGDVGLL